MSPSNLISRKSVSIYIYRSCTYENVNIKDEIWDRRRMWTSPVGSVCSCLFSMLQVFWDPSSGQCFFHISLLHLVGINGVAPQQNRFGQRPVQGRRL